MSDRERRPSWRIASVLTRLEGVVPALRRPVIRAPHPCQDVCSDDEVWAGPTPVGPATVPDPAGAPVLLLLSTSDTDLRSARAGSEDGDGSAVPWRWANPARVDPAQDLPGLLEGVDLVVVRLLGGRQAWEAGLDALLDARSQPRPVVVLGGEQAPDAQLMASSTVPVGVATQAHLYLAQGGPDNLRELAAFLSDTVLLTGFGFAPP